MGEVPQHEDRFVASMDLSSEVYWEQDDQYRFTVLLGRLEETGLDGQLGATPWDGSAVPIGDGGAWDAHRSALLARRPFSNFLYKRTNARREVRYLSSSGRPMFDASGSFIGYRGMASDVTRSVGMELRNDIQHEVTRILAVSEAVADTIPWIISVVCEKLGWACGARWDIEGGSARRAEAWSVPKAAIETFLAAGAAAAAPMSPATIVGRAWASGVPAWIEDIAADSLLERGAEAAEAGLRSAFAFPILAQGKVRGVLEFYSSELHGSDAAMVVSMLQLGEQIGDFLRRKEAEEELRQSKEALERTFEYMDQGISIFDDNLIALGMNRQYRELFDLPEALCKPGTPFEDFIRYNARRGDYGPGDVDEQVKTRVELARSFQPHHFERERRDGTILEIRGRPVPGNGFVTVYTDVTKRARAERAVRESEGRFRSLTELSSDWYWEQDENLHFTPLPEAAQAKSGYTAEKSIGKAFWELPDTAPATASWDELQSAMAARRTFRDFECRRTGGYEVRSIVVSGMPILDDAGKFRGYRGTGRDITEKKRAEELAKALAEEVLRQSKDVLEKTFEYMDQGISIMDAELKTVGTNRRFGELFGFPEALCKPGTPFEDYVRYNAKRGDYGPGDVEEQVRAQVEQERESQPHHYERERPDGTILEIRGYQVPGTGSVTIYTDVTKRARAQREMHESEARFRSLTELSSDWYWEQDENLHFTAMPEAAQAKSGYTAESWLGEALWELPDTTPLSGSWDDLKAAMAARKTFRDVECRHTVADEEVRYISVSGIPILVENGSFRGYRGTGRDITEKRRAKELAKALAASEENKQLEEKKRIQFEQRTAERLASVGTLAAGVAHEINNPLTFVIGNLTLLEEDVGLLSTTPAPEVIDRLEHSIAEARQGAHRVRDIVRDLKILSRPDEGRITAVDLNSVLESSINMAWNEIRHHARLEKDFARVSPVEGNESRLGQVFLNLLINAAQAIPEGHLADNLIRVSLRERAGRVIVEVSDTGAGIPPEIAARVFDPFFTTKEPGVGTGLGLAISHGIVTSARGEIRLRSEVGKGTTFTVDLPACAAHPAAEAAVVPAVDPRRRARVLMIDDEPRICTLVQRALECLHDVVTVTRAPEALERIARGEAFDLILCDLMMPEMTGEALHAEIARGWPELASKMVFLTGDAFTPSARAFLTSVPNTRVDKPIDIGALRALVAQRISAA